MIDVLSNYSFWIALCSPLIFVIICVFIIAKQWEGINTPIDLNWTAFNTPANTAVTVAGVAIPIVTGLVTYSFSTLKQTPEQLSPLIASIILMIGSILFGLWVSFSLATIVGKEGTFIISINSNNYYPAFLVSQLLLLFSGFGLLCYYCLNSLMLVPSTVSMPTTMTTAIPILRAHVNVGIKGNDVLNLWGIPQARELTVQGERLRYQLPNSEYIIQINNGEVTEITERKTTTR